MLKILSWNIRQGGGSRIKGILKSIKEVNPHIIGLSEWRNNAAGLEMRIALLRMGYLYQFVPPTTTANAVFLASKYAFSGLLCSEADANFPNNIVMGKFDAFDLYVVYLPHKKRHSLFPYLIERVKQSNRSTIIVGDYNTGHNGIDQKGNSFWYTDDLEELESSGMKDAFRMVHGNAEIYSWYSHQGNGYRYDHSYISEDLTDLIANCEYLHTFREEGISDHSPMLLSLGK